MTIGGTDWRIWIGACFLLLQLVLVLFGRSIDASLPRWAPNDSFVVYRFSVHDQTHELSADELNARYNMGIARSLVVS